MSKGLILVVEDEGVVALDLQHRLKALGYEVPVTVPSGEEAVEESKKLKPDLVLMDIQLRGRKDGVDAAQEIRNWNDVPVVFLTAYADERTVARAKLAHPYGYILKPFQEREMSATIEIALYKHRMQREMTHRERWFSAILRGIGDAVVVANTEQKITFVNPVAERLTGWRGNEALGRDASEVLRFVDERTRIPIENPISQALREGGDASVLPNALLVARDGGMTPIDDSAALIRDDRDEIWGVVLAFRDVLERRQHERRLFESEQRFRAILDSVQDAVLVHDLTGTRTFDANRRACELLGRPREELCGSGIEAWGTGEEPYSRRDALRWIHRSATGHAQAFEWRMRPPGGHQVLLEVNLKLAMIDGEPRILATMRDVTQRRLLEDQVSKTQKLEAIGQLAGGVAHDFNNLLTVINGYTSLLLTELKDDPANSAHAMQILSAGERAAALTQQLLALGRRQLMRPEHLDLNRLVAELSAMLERAIPEDIELQSNLPGDLLQILGDPTQIEQVILNLVFNARDAMPSGGILTISTRNVQVAEGLTSPVAVPPGRYVALTVSDTGTGMDEVTRARLFEPFFTTKRPGKGTGLGLATVYGIVRQTGGHIHVESQINRGTVFTIYFPAAPAEVKAKAEEPIPPDSIRGGETILLVEDDFGVRELVRRTLAGFGYFVLVAQNVEHAIELFEERREGIDLLVTDVVMPRMNGLELARKLQAMRPELKVLYMSGYADSVLTRGGSTEAAFKILQKPFSHAELGSAVREVLDLPASRQ